MITSKTLVILFIYTHTKLAKNLAFQNKIFIAFKNKGS